MILIIFFVSGNIISGWGKLLPKAKSTRRMREMKIKYGELAQLPERNIGFSIKINHLQKQVREMKIKYGELAQLVEHLLCTQGVRSSSLLFSTI